MQELDNKLQVNFSITLSAEAMAAAKDSGNCAHAVVTFAFEDAELQCDGEITLRLSIKN